MLNTEELNKILNLLNLSIRRENSHYLISNLNAQITDSLKQNGEYFEYDFEIYKTNYHLVISPKSLIITNDMNQMITINSGSFYYSKKDDHFDWNTELLDVDSHRMSFYKQCEETGNSISFLVHTKDNQYDYYKQSENIGKYGLIKYEIEAERHEGKTKEEEVKRRYNRFGTLIDIRCHEVYDDTPFDDYVISQFEDQTIINELLEMVETILPGVTTYIEEINPKITPLKNKNKEYKK